MKEEEKLMIIVEKVIYLTKKYTIIHIYTNRYCEIGDGQNDYKILLVKLSELK
jgi:hypothetical protein